MTPPFPITPACCTTRAKHSNKGLPACVKVSFVVLGVWVHWGLKASYCMVHIPGNLWLDTWDWMADYTHIILKRPIQFFHPWKVKYCLCNCANHYRASHTLQANAVGTHGSPTTLAQAECHSASTSQASHSIGLSLQPEVSGSPPSLRPNLSHLVAW